MNSSEIFNALFLSFFNRNDESINQIIANNSFITPNSVFYEIPPNFKVYGRSPFPLLNITSSFGYLEASQMLLESDADVDCTDGFNNSPLHCAACCGNIDLMNLLIVEYNCDPTPKNTDDDLPIHIAAIHNQNDAVVYLVNNKINKVDEKNYFGRTALSIAVEKNNLDLVQYLIIQCNSDATTIDIHKNTLLHIATENNCVPVLQYLLSLNIINVNSTNFDGVTPLHISAQKRNIEMFTALLSSQANPLLLDKKGRSVIHYSIKSSAFDIFDYIIQNKLAFPFQRDKTLATPFHYAAASPDIRFIQVLGSLDTTLINDMECGFAPLHIACKHQLLETVKFILSIPNIDPIVENLYGQNILHIAARSSNFTLFSYILAGKCFDISLVDINGWSPFHYAIKKGSYKMVKLLIDECSDPAILVADKKNFKIASKRGCKNIFMLFNSILDSTNFNPQQLYHQEEEKQEQNQEGEQEQNQEFEQSIHQDQNTNNSELDYDRQLENLPPLRPINIPLVANRSTILEWPII